MRKKKRGKPVVPVAGVEAGPFPRKQILSTTTEKRFAVLRVQHDAVQTAVNGNKCVFVWSRFFVFKFGRVKHSANRKNGRITTCFIMSCKLTGSHIERSLFFIAIGGKTQNLCGRGERTQWDEASRQNIIHGRKDGRTWTGRNIPFGKRGGTTPPVMVLYDMPDNVPERSRRSDKRKSEKRCEKYHSETQLPFSFKKRKADESLSTLTSFKRTNRVLCGLFEILLSAVHPMTEDACFARNYPHLIYIYIGFYDPSLYLLCG